jgi:PIN domain nuclease of toxin-antitoxin system
MTPVVLDTHVLIWLVGGDARLGAKARALAQAAATADALCVSAASFWEASRLAARGRLVFVTPLGAWRRAVLALGVRELPVGGDIAIEGGALAGFKGDAADRIIAASAIHLGATLLTGDGRLLDWPGALARQDARV